MQLMQLSVYIQHVEVQKVLNFLFDFSRSQLEILFFSYRHVDRMEDSAAADTQTSISGSVDTTETTTIDKSSSNKSITGDFE